MSKRCEPPSFSSRRSTLTNNEHTRSSTRNSHARTLTLLRFTMLKRNSQKPHVAPSHAQPHTPHTATLSLSCCGMCVSMCVVSCAIPHLLSKFRCVLSVFLFSALVLFLFSVFLCFVCPFACSRFLLCLCDACVCRFTRNLSASLHHTCSYSLSLLLPAPCMVPNSCFNEMQTQKFSHDKTRIQTQFNSIHELSRT